MNNNFLDFLATTEIIFNLRWFNWLNRTSFTTVFVLISILVCWYVPLLWKEYVLDIPWQKTACKMMCLSSELIYYVPQCYICYYQCWGSSAEDRETNILWIFFYVKSFLPKGYKRKTCWNTTIKYPVASLGVETNNFNYVFDSPKVILISPFFNSNEAGMLQ